jgi:hypothetical protein
MCHFFPNSMLELFLFIHTFREFMNCYCSVYSRVACGAPVLFDGKSLLMILLLRLMGNYARSMQTWK